MKKQIAAVFTAAFVLGSFTACRNKTVESRSENQSSKIESSSLISNNQSLVSQDQDSTLSSVTSSTSGESSESDDEPLFQVEEVKQILKPLKEYGDLYWGMFPFELNEELVDMEQAVSIELSGIHGTITRLFYKVVNGDIQTEEQFIAKLDSVLTEKMKKEFLENPERPFEFSGGDLYIDGRGAGGWGPDYDDFYLDSVKYAGENTVVVKGTSVYNGSEGLYEPFSDTVTAALVKTADGFRIDACDDISFFYRCREIIYGSETIKL